MNSFIERHHNQRGFTTNEYYSPSRIIPTFYVNKYHYYDDMIDSLAQYINGY